MTDGQASIPQQGHARPARGTVRQALIQLCYRLLPTCHCMFGALTKDVALWIATNSIGREMEPEIMSALANAQTESADKPAHNTMVDDGDRK
jgi:hypothetical protein